VWMSRISFSFSVIFSHSMLNALSHPVRRQRRPLAQSGHSSGQSTSAIEGSSRRRASGSPQQETPKAVIGNKKRLWIKRAESRGFSVQN
jgi:hypothetical protein